MKKIISIILALTTVLSVGTSAFAVASTAKLSITDDVKTVKAGDIIEAVVIINTTEDLANYTNTIKYDKEVFELIDSVAYEEYAALDDSKSMLEKALEKDPTYTMEKLYLARKKWNSKISDTMINYWTENADYKLPGGFSLEIINDFPVFLSNGSTPVDMFSCVDNAVIAAARLKVKDNAPAGLTEIYTTDVAISDGTTDTKLSTIPIAITVEADEPVLTPIDNIKVAASDYKVSDPYAKADGSKYYNAGFIKEIAVGATNTPVAGITLKGANEVPVMFGTTVKSAETINVAINILDVPFGTELPGITISPIAETTAE